MLILHRNKSLFSNQHECLKLDQYSYRFLLITTPDKTQPRCFSAIVSGSINVVIILLITELRSLHFLPILFKNQFFCFLVFRVFSPFCFELEFIFIDFYSIFVSIIYIGTKCYATLFSPEVIKILA